MEFLTASNKKGLGDTVELFDNGTLNAQGKNVVVIGGGIQQWIVLGLQSDKKQVQSNVYTEETKKICLVQHVKY